jgi:hypothetical protein
MSIRIRVYPQYGSIGWHRNRGRRIHQQQLRQNFAWQQQLIQQQALQQQMYGGFGGYGSSFSGGYGSSYGSYGGYGSTGYSSPYGSSWGYASQVPGYGSVGSAWSGAYALPGYGQSNYVSQYSGGYSPVGYAYSAGLGRGWGC